MTSVAGEARHQRRPRRRLEDWRYPESSPVAGRTPVLRAAGLAAGLGIAAASLINSVLGPELQWASSLTLWVCLGAAIFYVRSVEGARGLFVFKVEDVIWGLAAGLGLRLVQGFVTAQRAPFPSRQSVDGALEHHAWLFDLVSAGLIGPTIEELFFRGVLLVSVYMLMRRRAGALMAGAVAIGISTAAFVALHFIFDPMTLAALLQFALVGVICGGVLLLTGRIAGAIVSHITYNASFLLLVEIGTLLS